MEDVIVQLNEQGDGGFYIMDGEDQLAEMAVGIRGKNLTAYHTEVDPKAEGKGMAKRLLAAMVEYARKNKMQVIPLCPFVHAQFKRHPEEYADVWMNGVKKEE